MNRQQRRLEKKKAQKKNQQIVPMTFEDAQKNALLKQGLDVGLDLVEMKKYDEAEHLFKGLLEHAPGLTVLHYNLGTIEVHRSNTEKAMKYFRKGITINPNDHNCLCGLGLHMVEMGQPEEGLLFCKKAVDIKETSFTLGIYATALNHMGRFEESRKMMERILEIDPTNTQAFVSIAQSNKLDADDPLIPKMEEVFEKRDELFEDDYETRARIGFALGKTYHDQKDYDRAFEAYKAGNEDRGQAYGMHGDTVTAYVKQIQKIFTKDLYQEYKGLGYKSDKPVFLIGMPRSGTTLTEQIISSHPDVFGAGELRAMQNAVIDPDNVEEINAKSKRDNDIDDDLIGSMSEEKLKKIGKAYVDYINTLAPKAKRVTDKMPFNFYRAGLIKLALPDAKIIYCRRNPMDIGLSVYRQNFKEDFFWAYDLQRIGKTLIEFQKIMDYWIDMMGDDILISDYESLVSNPEEESRRLIDFCDLEWNDACLSPHKTKRSVKTASFAQVRAPINTKSIEGWRKYEKGLRPLADMLGIE